MPSVHLVHPVHPVQNCVSRDLCVLSSDRTNFRSAAIKFVLAGVLIWAMIHFRMLDLSVLLRIASRPAHLAAAAALLMAGLLLTVVRWRALLAIQGIRVPHAQAVRLGFIGFFFSSVIPGAVSGDAVKAWYVAREHGQTAPAIASVLLDRFIGLYTMVLAAAAAIAICWHGGQYRDAWAAPGIAALSWSIIALSAAMTLFSLALLSRRLKGSRALAAILRRIPLGSHVAKLHDAVHLNRGRLGSLGLIVVLSVAAQVPMILSNFVIGRAIGDDGLSLPMYFFLASVGLVINSIPVMPGGLGTGELGYAMLFRAFGCTIGAEIIAVWHILFFGWSLIGLAFYVKGRRHAPAMG